MSARLIIIVSLFFFKVVVLCNAQNKDKKAIDFAVDSLKKENLEIGYILFDRYILAGEIDSIYSENKKRISDFGLMDTYADLERKYQLHATMFCDTFLSSCMNFYFIEVEMEDSILILTAYYYLPSRVDWVFQDQPMIRYVLKMGEQELTINSIDLLLNAKLKFNNNTKSVIEEYKKIKKKGLDSYFKKKRTGIDELIYFIDKLFISSFYDGECKKIFENLPTDYRGLTEGAFGEIYYSYLILFEKYKHR